MYRILQKRDDVFLSSKWEKVEETNFMAFESAPRAVVFPVKKKREAIWNECDSTSLKAVIKKSEWETFKAHSGGAHGRGEDRSQCNGWRGGVGSIS